MSEIRSACRLLVALSTQRGAPRRTVLTALVNAIRDNATVSVSVGAEEEGEIEGDDLEGLEGGVNEMGGNGDDTARTSIVSAVSTRTRVCALESPDACSRRLRCLTRLASMVTLVVKASGSTGIPDPTSATHVPQVRDNYLNLPCYLLLIEFWVLSSTIYCFEYVNLYKK